MVSKTINLNVVKSFFSPANIFLSLIFLVLSAVVLRQTSVDILGWLLLIPAPTASTSCITAVTAISYGWPFSFLSINGSTPCSVATSFNPIALGLNAMLFFSVIGFLRKALK